MSFPRQPLKFERATPAKQLADSRAFLEVMKRRRSVRHFAADPIPAELIENAIRVAGSAPSGANQQPWHFAVVQDAAIKAKIRAAAETEERENYDHRFPAEWLQALAPFGTDWHKEFLEIAPCLIVMFRQDYALEVNSSGHERKIKHYYVNESSGIAAGFLLATLHLSGLATLVHTPSPMGFLAEILERPKNERAMLLIPVGYPAKDASVPVITKKELSQILTWK